jgi:N-acetylmuramoyl-L-alanine amidase
MRNSREQLRRNKIETPRSSLVRRIWLERLSLAFLVLSVIAVIALIGSAVFTAVQPREMVVAVAPAPIKTMMPTLMPLPTFTPAPTLTPLPPPVALVAGHSGGADTGAICPDGLREVDITTDVAKRAKMLLELRGYRVDILAEFDARLSATKRDYAPRAFLSIHADSCVYYASGYKVARADNSAIPREDDRLVRCVSNAYGVATQLPFHAGSITTDMTRYHGLEEIAPNSPGAILELGFLGSDKDVLVNRRDLIALGIMDGIDSFLKGNGCQ